MTTHLDTSPTTRGFSTIQPKAASSKKPAAAPYPGGKPSTGAAKKNPLFEKKPKNFGIG